MERYNEFEEMKVSEIEKPIHKSAILTYADKYGSNLGTKLVYSHSSKLASNKIFSNNQSQKTKDKSQNNLHPLYAPQKANSASSRSAG